MGSIVGSIYSLIFFTFKSGCMINVVVCLVYTKNCLFHKTRIIIEILFPSHCFTIIPFRSSVKCEYCMRCARDIQMANKQKKKMYYKKSEPCTICVFRALFYEQNNSKKFKYNFPIKFLIILHSRHMR